MARHPLKTFLKQKEEQATATEEGRSSFIEKTIERLSKQEDGNSHPQEFFSRYFGKMPS